MKTIVISTIITWLFCLVAITRSVPINGSPSIDPAKQLEFSDGRDSSDDSGNRAIRQVAVNVGPVGVGVGPFGGVGVRVGPWFNLGIPPSFRRAVPLVYQAPIPVAYPVPVAYQPYQPAVASPGQYSYSSDYRYNYSY